MPKSLFFVPDSHHPYVDKWAWSVCLQAIELFKPDILINLGDHADCYKVSKFRKDPARKESFDDEMAGAARGMAELNAAAPAACERHLFLGNHENRLPDYLAERAPEIYNMVSIEKLLELDKLKHKWTVTPYKHSRKFGKLYASHDFGFSGRTAIRETRNLLEACAVQGHLHRMEVFYKGNARAKGKVAACFGWLGDYNKVDYRHRDAAKRDYQHGFGTGYMESDGTVWVQAVPIVNRKAILERKIIRG